MKNTLILVCSHRKNSNSRQVGEIVKVRTHSFFPESTATVLDFGENPMRMWDEGIWNGDSEWEQELKELNQATRECDSLVMIVPEYAGMASPMAKNVLLMLSTELVGHKPGLLISVSAGMGGSYPVAEIRMSSYKNNRIVWIPDHVIVRSAGDFRAPFEEPRQQETLTRLDHGIKILGEYAQALYQVRSSDSFAKQPFPFGM